MKLDAPSLARLTGSSLNSNLKSVMSGLERFGDGADLNRPHRLAAFLANLVVESGNFRWDREIWGPTPVQRRYEGRKDLGNTQPGDGKKFAGHGPIQITGRYNTTQFWRWCSARFNDVPDFVERPDLINTDPWEGLSAIWYWDDRKINRAADAHNFDKVVKIINGGYGHLKQRREAFVAIGLRILGYTGSGYSAVRSFQGDAGLKTDGLVGPLTVAAMSRKLSEADEIQFGDLVPPVDKPDAPPVPAPALGAGFAALLAAAFRFFLGRKS